ncbi:MAG: 30S ribosomal protein S9 [Bacteroidia bacterium]|nr:30S ribosomal protein S9 [Bacteroidia bacterium]
MEIINAIGRRKASIARIYLSEGKGNITVNNRDFKEYFPVVTLQHSVLQPLKVLNVSETYDISVNMYGGGMKGQSEALQLAIARALVKINAEDKPALRAAGLLTRDPREVERKKPGQKKARKRFQFSKR